MFEKSLEEINSEILLAIENYPEYSEQLQAIQETQSVLSENISVLCDSVHNIENSLYWIFFVLCAYGLYKFFVGNILSWFNGS